MKMNTVKLSASKNTNTLVVFTLTSGDKDKKLIAAKGLPGSEFILEAFKNKEFASSKNETILFRNANSGKFKHILAIGLGDKKTVSEESLRSLGAQSFKALAANKISAATVKLDEIASLTKKPEQAYSAFVEGAYLADYNFDYYMSKKSSKKEKDTTIELALEKGSTSVLTKAHDSAQTLADCVNLSKVLGDTPGNLMTPDILCKTLQKAAKGTGLKVTVWDKAKIKKERFGGLLGVSLGSEIDPRFIIMEYKGAAASKKPLAFVGKGLTFDCGGISIKPSAAMDEMKYDMCGGANVIGAMLAIARLKLKVNVVAYVPSTENMPGGLATKPGDILTFRNGKTAEVLNTDAEGRLILADALAYASEKKPAAIVDAATLTGAMVMALGNSYTGLFGNNKSFIKKMEDSASSTGEKVWHLPMDEDHLKDMKGAFADLANISSFRGAGSSTAAAFLSEFVDNDIPWIHCDIAGTAWNCANRLNYVPKKGATGSMVRTFVELAKKF